MAGSGRYFFASDMHLGAAGCENVQEQFLKFLAGLPDDTSALYLLGDVFDFWFERGGGCPAGFDSVLEAIRQVVQRGIKVYFFRGNHDWWTFGYLATRTGATVVTRQPVFVTLAGKRFCLAHGDGLGRISLRDRATRLLLKGWLSISLARIVPARWLYTMARKWSAASRHSNTVNPYVFDKESPLYRYACSVEKATDVDYFIFGHIHRDICMPTGGGAQLYILNDWSGGPDWIEFDGGNVSRKNCTFEN